MANNISHALKTWLPFALLLTLVCGMIYGTVQQVYRQSANDPQIQMAEDTAAALEKGAKPTRLIGDNSIDMAKSLAPYTVMYDDELNPLAANVIIDGATPRPPRGVFEYARAHGEDRLTWQPQPGVRSAIVVVHYGGTKSGFVLAGRSLREVEIRESRLVLSLEIGWLVSMMATLGAVFLAQKFGTGKHS